jgi:hypothetical protein
MGKKLIFAVMVAFVLVMVAMVVGIAMTGGLYLIRDV